MINQPNQSFSQGHFLSELITINQGKYIVKVSIKLQQEIVATGLAGADSIEVAEDRARERALSHLQFSTTTEVTKAKDTKIVSEPLPETNLPKTVTSSIVNPPVSEAKSQEEVNIEQIQATAVTEPPEVEIYAPSEEPSTIPDDLMNSPDFVSQTMNEINLEMSRLNWTKEQGRDYLLRTYGKKSRHLLSDPELLEFLDYLKKQP